MMEINHCKSNLIALHFLFILTVAKFAGARFLGG